MNDWIPLQRSSNVQNSWESSILFFSVDERLKPVRIRIMTRTCVLLSMCWAEMQVTVNITMYKHWMGKKKCGILPPLCPSADCFPPPASFGLNVDYVISFISSCTLSTAFHGLHSRSKIARSATPLQFRTDCWPILPVSTCHSASRLLRMSTNSFAWGMRLTYLCLQVHKLFQKYLSKFLNLWPSVSPLTPESTRHIPQKRTYHHRGIDMCMHNSVREKKDILFCSHCPSLGPPPRPIQQSVLYFHILLAAPSPPPARVRLLMLYP